MDGRNVRGFTLLEMLAVIVLVAIATAAASVAVTQGLSSARVRSAGNELAAALRATRAQAIVHASERTFELDTRSNSYGEPQHAAVALPRGMQVSMTSAAQGAPNAWTGRIRFFPDGSSTGGRITLRANQREWHVNVSWLTGEVRVRDAVAGR